VGAGEVFTGAGAAAGVGTEAEGRVEVPRPELACLFSNNAM